MTQSRGPAGTLVPLPGLCTSALAQLAAVGKDAGIDGRLIESMQTFATEGLKSGYGSVGNAVLFKLFRGK